MDLKNQASRPEANGVPCTLTRILLLLAAEASTTAEQHRGPCCPRACTPVGGIYPDGSGHALGPTLSTPAWIEGHFLELPEGFWISRPCLML